MTNRDRSARGIARGLTLLAVAVLPGCAAMTVDVDVYKGAFINQTDVQREQVAALAMGAKPLLRELQLRLVLQQCYEESRLAALPFGGDPFDKFKGAVLEQAKGGGAGNPVGAQAQGHERPVPEQAKGGGEGKGQTDQKKCAAYSQLRRSSDGDSSAVSQPLYGPPRSVERILSLYSSIDYSGPTTMRFVQQLARRMRALRAQLNEVASATTCQGPDVETCQKSREKLQSLADGTLDVALEFLASKGNLSALGADGEALGAVGEVIKGMLSTKRMCTEFSAHEAGKKLPKTKELLAGGCPPPEKDGSLPNDGDVLTRVGEQLSSPGGSALFSELLMLHTAAMRANAIGLSVDDPWTMAPKSVDTEIAKLTKVVSRFDDAGTADLDGGRDTKGLEQVIRDFIEQSNKVVAAPDDSPGGTASSCFAVSRCRAAAFAMERALVHFAQKLLTLSDFDVLLKDTGQNSASDNYVRVLQAVGNSILSQVNELAVHRDYVKRIRYGNGSVSLGEMEARAIDRANAARTRPVVEAVEADWKAQVAGGKIPDSVIPLADRDKVAAALVKGADSHQEILDLLTVQKVRVGAFLEGRRPVYETALKLDEAAKKLGGSLCKLPVDGTKTAGELLDGWASGDTSGLKREEWKALVETSPAKEALAGCNSKVDECLHTCVDAIVTVMTADRRAAEAVKDSLTRWAGSLARAGRDPLPVSGSDSVFGSTASAQPPWSGLKDPREVLDLTLSALRMELVAEVRSNGESEAAKRLQLAIKLLEQQRQRYVYIRAPVSYLRNSTPTSALQDESAVTWTNLLRENLWRAGPGPNQAAREKGRIQQAIDKQYWHSVNRIRVGSGPGNVNYVLARDDIGNWYVKSYSSDSSQVFRSALNLALFAAAGRPGQAAGQQASLLGAMRTSPVGPPALAGGAAGPGGEAKPVARDASTLDRLLVRYDKEYWTRLRAECVASKGQLDALKTSLRTASMDALPDKTERTNFQTSMTDSEGGNDTLYFPAVPSVAGYGEACVADNAKKLDDAPAVRRAELDRVHKVTMGLIEAMRNYGADVTGRLEHGFATASALTITKGSNSGATDAEKQKVVLAAVSGKVSAVAGEHLGVLDRLADDYAGNLRFMTGAVDSTGDGATAAEAAGKAATN